MLQQSRSDIQQYDTDKIRMSFAVMQLSENCEVAEEVIDKNTCVFWSLLGNLVLSHTTEGGGQTSCSRGTHPWTQNDYRRAI